MVINIKYKKHKIKQITTMKKILISLSIIGVVGAIAVGGTIAYFSDTETSTGNTFTAGTIDIAIDGSNPWNKNYTIGDLKPGETGYINFDITNVGKNPVNVSKNVGYFQESTGTVSEPECTDQSGWWDNPGGGCNWNWNNQNHQDLNNVQTQIKYDLSVKVYSSQGEGNLIWWQDIYTDAEGQTLSTVYPSNTTYVALGMIPVGGHMKVTQSYHFSSQAGNAYQGDTLSFNITIKGEQLAQGDNGLASVVLENKSGAPNWDILQSDTINGTLNYQTSGAKLNYNFTGTVNTAGTYTLIYVGLTGDYPATESKFLGQVVSSGTSVTLSGSVDTGSITSGKIWLVPATTYNSGSAADGTFTGWDHTNNLYETALINYVKN